LHGTLDLVATGHRLWNVGRDREVALRAPRRGNDPLMEVGVQPAGHFAVVDWSNCAGPCTLATVVGADGRETASFGGGGPVVRLSDRAFVHVSEYGDAHLLDDAGHLIASHDFGTGWADEPAVVRLDDDHFAVLVDAHFQPDGYLLYTVDVLGDSLFAQQTRFIPLCP
jgi:hypothetical protein